MAVIKGLLVGILTLSIVTVVYIPSATFVLLRKYAPPPGVHVGIDVVALINRPVYWLIAIAAFALGFYLEFSRAR